MVVSHHRREVSNYRNDLVVATAQETEHAAIRVVGIHPLESARIKFALVESRFTSVEVVQVPHPGLHSGVQRELKDPPLQAFLVGPLAFLPELVAHEEQLLARLRPLISEEQAQGGELLPLVARHVTDERAFAVHHLIVRERQHVVLGEHIEAAEGELVVIEAAMDGILRQVFERVVHPSHVPLEAEAEPAHGGGLRDHGPGGGLLGDGLHVGMAAVHVRIQLLQEADGLQVFVAAVLVGNPLALGAGIVQVEHGGDRVHA